MISLPVLCSDSDEESGSREEVEFRKEHPFPREANENRSETNLNQGPRPILHLVRSLGMPEKAFSIAELRSGRQNTDRVDSRWRRVPVENFQWSAQTFIVKEDGLLQSTHLDIPVEAYTSSS